MGALFSSLGSLLFSPVPTKTMMIGLDGAGKTTILYHLKLSRRVTTIPTIGFNVETISYNNFTITLWDICGQDRLRPLYRYYFADTVGMVFVVDSTDVERIGEVKEELWRMLNELDDAGLNKIPVLVYANKQDLQTAMMVSEVKDALDLMSVKDREWHIQGASAIDGEGLKDGLD
ncbi:hypothetical protein BGZ65_009082, partial [Modicella reniformis]